MFMIVFLLGTVALLAGGQEVCPEPCNCDCEESMSCVDCSGRGLTELPVFADMNIEILDLSDNMFTTIPAELGQFRRLHYLDMSANAITELPEDALNGMSSLSILILSQNNISNWADIHPNRLLLPAGNLKELRLAKNRFTSFSSNDESLVLTSLSLRYLDLSECSISKVSGQAVIQGLRSLEHLKLTGNPIESISDMQSTSLKKLELNNCKLSTLQPTVFSGLKALKEINLARNYRLSLVLPNEIGHVQSASLRKINLSHCNMDSIDLQGFPNLITAIIRENMVRQLGRESFNGTLLLEHLDLSSNSINSVHPEAFRLLKHLKTLDLSFNMISRVDGKLFKNNDLLTHINLSRNYISRFSRIAADSLVYLNMSWCEILTIDWDALGAMGELIELDLSNNLISDIPDTIASGTLQTLDLSMCRLSTLRNTTLSGLPELTRINLSGNRFTTPFRVEFFDRNPYLSEIWLGDNPWRCDCRSDDFFQFFQYLTDPPGRIGDRKNLQCNAPEDFFGASWEAACRSVWYPYETMGNAERIWTWLMVSILSFFGVCCLISSIRKFISTRKKLNAEREQAENLQELREIARENRVRLQQDAPQNAPDARESRPPCYEDAIQLPKLDAASFASLDELLMRGKRKKRRRHRRSSGTDAKDDDDDEEERIQLRQRSRTRSEDVLSRRIDNTSSGPSAVVQSIYERPTSNRVVTDAEVMIHTSGRRRSGSVTQEDRDREEDEELHYHSIDILSLHHQPSSASGQSGPMRESALATPRASSSQSGPITPIENFTAHSHSPYAKRKVKPLQHLNPNGSIEEITDFADRKTSPYAKRRNPLLSSFRKLPPLPDRSPPPIPGTVRTSNINLVENYFQPADQHRLLDELDDYAVIPMQINLPPAGTNDPQPSTSRTQPMLLQQADLMDDPRPNISDSSETTSSVSIEIIQPSELRK
ncbi:AGAP006643-PA-like protein [Anopheles sinensis]|uniref:AGAP006643-PA-like protein n=1 Tax=Anopheles sinensis TaxID=74873 RepID=A0A084WME0_ANOSI|nr:AGAP006643-PA-like protein [Anopheles sinensis]